MLGGGEQSDTLANRDSEQQFISQYVIAGMPGPPFHGARVCPTRSAFRHKTNLCRSVLSYSLPGKVTFENKKGEMHLIGVDELTTLFKAGNSSSQEPCTKLVFVSACSV